ncbi:nucleotidyltransferase family protein [Sphingomonas oryzagri]
MRLATILLAAGRSRRFGEADKLAAALGDLPLGLHAARTLAALPAAMKLVVTGPTGLEWPDFRTILNDRPSSGMAHSIRLGLSVAERVGADCVLIALADMPFVEEGHFLRLIGAYQGPDTLVASSSRDRRMPPALFGANWFGALASLTGDEGARGLLNSAETIPTDPDTMLDVDGIADLEIARARIRP